MMILLSRNKFIKIKIKHLNLTSYQCSFYKNILLPPALLFICFILQDLQDHFIRDVLKHDHFPLF